MQHTSEQLVSELTQQKNRTERLQDPNLELTDMLKEIGFEGLNDEERLTLIEHATLDDFMTAIYIIHQKVAPGHTADIHPDPVKIVNPETGEVNHITASPVERVDVMQHALTNAKLLIQRYRQEGGSAQDVLQRCGNLAGFSIVLAHNFDNGNGRTARTIGELIHSGYHGEESLSDIATVSANRPSKGFRINSYTPAGEWADQANKSPLAFLDVVAQLNQPFDNQSYQIAVRSILTTPRM